jgi:hypothetical protein
LIDREMNESETVHLSPYYHRGGRWFLEGFYIWLGKRLPAGLVFYATNQLLEYAESEGMNTLDIVEAQSNWLIDKMK